MITVAPKVNQAKPSLKLDLNNLTDEQKVDRLMAIIIFDKKRARLKVKLNKKAKLQYGGIQYFSIK